MIYEEVGTQIEDVRSRCTISGIILFSFNLFFKYTFILLQILKHKLYPHIMHKLNESKATLVAVSSE